MSVSDTSSITALTDDTSRTATTFATTTPAVTWTSWSGAITVNSHTLTSGPSGAAPKSWHLDGSMDGVKWKRLDTRKNESFTWQTQTRPFELRRKKDDNQQQATNQSVRRDGPGVAHSYTRYCLTIDQTSTGVPVTMSELELLATPGTVGPLALTPVAGLKAGAGANVTAPLATVSGATGKVASDYTVTADFLDGKGPQPATLTGTPLRTRTVTAPHTFTDSGEYPVIVTASQGTFMVGTFVPVSTTRDGTLAGSFDTSCIGDPGVGANCDSKNWAFNRQLLANTGFVLGTTVKVPDTDLSFDLPAAAPGNLDSATGNGLTIPLNLGAGASQLSVIGTATQSTQHTTGTLTFSDGTAADPPVDYGDWVGSETTPIPGNMVVGSSAGRFSGASGSDGQSAAIFSSAPYTIPAGKTVTSPTQTGDPGSAGRIYVFAIASSGDRAAQPALSATGTPITAQKAHTAFTANLATATGGAPPTPDGYTARVNWGDGTPLTTATVTPGTGAGPAIITGQHSYTTSGDYTVAVTVDDGIKITVTTTSVQVN